MLWIKTLHIIFMVAWFAALFYLPRLYVYHAATAADDDAAGNARFKIMERRLFWSIMTPAAAATLFFGGWLWLGYGISGRWLMWKLPLVAALVAYHFWCYVCLRKFARDCNTRAPGYYRLMNEIPTLLLIGIVALTVIKPL